MLVGAVLILTIMLVTALIGIRNLLIQVESYEDRLSTNQEFFEVVQGSLKDIINRMRAIDIGGHFKPMGPDEGDGLVEVNGVLQMSKPGAFERSDEVSSTFKSMLLLIEQLDAYVTPPTLEENATTETTP